MLNAAASRARQQRLLPHLAIEQLDAAVIAHPKHVYYLTAHLPFWQQHAAVILWSDGRSWLVTGNEPNSNAAADEVVSYEASWQGTQRQEQPVVVAEHVIRRLRESSARRIGIDSSIVSSQIMLQLDEKAASIDPVLWQLRRQKDPDELALMRKAIDCSKAMHERARQIVEPGVDEVFVFSALQKAAVTVAGEPMWDPLGNDYACGVGGGPPRAGRKAEAGELYILDLGPVYQGYFADNSRAYSVGRKPSDAQQNAWDAVMGVFPIVERLARPGARCREIFAAVSAHYRSKLGIDFPHHLGHGVGLQPHEYPHLNPKWDDVLLENEIFTAEPGVYSPDLRGGMRLENQYLVTPGGVENLTPFPMALT